MKLIVNDIERAITSPPLTSLLQVLREELGITSPKAGCQQGGCGTCTVLVAGPNGGTELGVSRRHTRELRELLLRRAERS